MKVVGSSCWESKCFSAFTTGKWKVWELASCVQCLQGFSGLGIEIALSMSWTPSPFYWGEEGWYPSVPHCEGKRTASGLGCLIIYLVEAQSPSPTPTPHTNPALCSSEYLASLVKVLRAQMQATISSFFFFFLNWILGINSGHGACRACFYHTTSLPHPSF